MSTFVNQEVEEELKKIPQKEEGISKFQEHSFIATCLKTGITIKDLKILSYIDVMKILLSYLENKKETGTKKATKEDIKRFIENS